MLGQPVDDRPQMDPGDAHPVGQGTAMDIDPRPGEDLALAMQWEVVGVIADQHVGDGTLGRQAALDQRCRHGRLPDTVSCRSMHLI